MSLVNKVEQELNTDASELIKAASRPAATSPLNPAGSTCIIKAGNAWSAASHSSSPLSLSAKCNYTGDQKEENRCQFQEILRR